MTSYCRERLTFTAHQRPTVGDTKMSVIHNDHLGWLMCNGRALSVSDYYLLFRVIGYSFGGADDTFYLPNAAGRVPGVIGTGTDINSSTFTVALGASIGEYEHTLSIAEMPAHKHGPVDVTGNTNGTGFTDLSGAHTHTINDPGHNHTLGDIPDGTQTIAALGGGSTTAADEVRYTGTTSSSSTGISINSNGLHAHAIGSTGGDLAHNNVQPMIGLGNMFIYCGKTMYPMEGFPYTIGTNIL